MTTQKDPSSLKKPGLSGCIGLAIVFLVLLYFLQKWGCSLLHTEEHIRMIG